MDRITRMAFAAAVVAGTMAGVGCCGSRGGCGGGLGRDGGDRVGLGERYRNAVDPSWPERYNHVARLETLAPFQVQAQNGQYLDHTVWNYHFEKDSDKLSPAGIERLDYIVRKRGPQDGRVYLQTARDGGFDPNTPEKLADGRRDLDARRGNAVLKYLAAQTAAAPVPYEVWVHDPADPAFPAAMLANAVRGLPNQYTSSIGGGAGGGGGGTAIGGNVGGGSGSSSGAAPSGGGGAQGAGGAGAGGYGYR